MSVSGSGFGHFYQTFILEILMHITLILDSIKAEPKRRILVQVLYWESSFRRGRMTEHMEMHDKTEGNNK